MRKIRAQEMNMDGGVVRQISNTYIVTIGGEFLGALSIPGSVEHGKTLDILSLIQKHIREEIIREETDKAAHEPGRK